ncbi:MAG: hypothetical protein IJC25_05540 [Clostridia bacterium]|nr:hypothetical protein [Clostridia bacterium]MBQ3141405.1 hypothetical protein [Clostridia bacterium]
MNILESASVERLFRIIQSLETPEECRLFFEDICTIREIQDMAQRLDVAILLREGKNYQEISAETAVSSATISRVNRCLLYGGGGYRMALDKSRETEEQA